MAGLLKCHVRVVGGGFVTHEFPSDAVLSFNQVAVTLGVSASTLRRLLREGKFPQSHISRGRRDYWQRHEVRAYCLRRLLIDDEPPASRSRYQDADAIEREDERDFGRKPLDLQASERSLDTFTKLLKEDPNQFVSDHPKLRRWLKEKGLL